MSEAFIQVVALLGSLGVLAAYGASQTRWLSTASLPYILLNLGTSCALATVAIIERQWGFPLLEGGSGRWSASGASFSICADARSSPPDTERSGLVALAVLR